MSKYVNIYSQSPGRLSLGSTLYGSAQLGPRLEPSPGQHYRLAWHGTSCAGLKSYLQVIFGSLPYPLIEVPSSSLWGSGYEISIHTAHKGESPSTKTLILLLHPLCWLCHWLYTTAICLGFVPIFHVTFTRNEYLWTTGFWQLCIHCKLSFWHSWSQFLILLQVSMLYICAYVQQQESLRYMGLRITQCLRKLDLWRLCRMLLTSASLYLVSPMLLILYSEHYLTLIGRWVSTENWFILLDDSPLAWSSKQQLIVALSSCKAEYVSTSHCAHDVLWFRNLFLELSYLQTMATILFCDNQGTVSCTHNPHGHTKMKHIAIRYHFIHDYINWCYPYSQLLISSLNHLHKYSINAGLSFWDSTTVKGGLEDDAAEWLSSDWVSPY